MASSKSFLEYYWPKKNGDPTCAAPRLGQKKVEECFFPAASGSLVVGTQTPLRTVSYFLEPAFQRFPVPSWGTLDSLANKCPDGGSGLEKMGHYRD
jgi:hypothetical protein